MKQIYVANCIEDGVRFTSTFQTSETDKSELYDMGKEMAMGWGAECLSVKKLKLKEYKMAKLYDKKEDKWVVDTEKRITNFIKKHLNSTRYDYAKTQYYSEMEKMPEGHVWDCDLSTDENLAKCEDLKKAGV